MNKEIVERLSTTALVGYYSLSEEARHVLLLAALRTSAENTTCTITEEDDVESVEALWEIGDELVGTYITVNTTSVSEFCFRWVDSLVETETGITITWAEESLPFVQELREQFTRLKSRGYREISDIYAARLYDVLYRDLHTYVWGEVEINLSVLTSTPDSGFLVGTEAYKVLLQSMTVLHALGLVDIWDISYLSSLRSNFVTLRYIFSKGERNGII